MVQRIKCLFNKHKPNVQAELYRNYWQGIQLDTFTLVKITKCNCCNTFIKVDIKGEILYDLVMSKFEYRKLIKRN